MHLCLCTSLEHKVLNIVSSTPTPLPSIPNQSKPLEQAFTVKFVQRKASHSFVYLHLCDQIILDLVLTSNDRSDSIMYVHKLITYKYHTTRTLI